MRHQFYTRKGNRYALEDLEEHNGSFDLRFELHFEGIIPRNVMIRVDGIVFVISQTMIEPKEMRVLYLLREKGNTQI